MQCRDFVVRTAAVASVFVSGCGSLSGDSEVVVIDLAAVAKATGQDKAMAEQLEAARRELGTQLAQVAGDLEKQLQVEQTRLGGAVAASREKEFQQLTAQARQQLADTQALAQQKAQDFQVELAANYRRAVEPVAAEIARSRGAAVVLVADATMLWFDSAADITDEVIADLRARPAALALPSVAAPEPVPPAPEKATR